MAIRVEQEELKEKFAAAEAEYAEVDRGLDKWRQAVDILQREVRRFRSKLPNADQKEIAEAEDRLTGLKHEVNKFRKERDDAEEKIGSLLEHFPITPVRNRFPRRELM